MKKQQNDPAKEGIKFNINLKDATDIECEKCKNKIFDEKVMFKRLSALLSPTGQKVIIPLKVFECSSCKTRNEEISPQV